MDCTILFSQNIWPMELMSGLDPRGSMPASENEIVNSGPNPEALTLRVSYCSNGQVSGYCITLDVSYWWGYMQISGPSSQQDLTSITWWATVLLLPWPTFVTQALLFPLLVSVGSYCAHIWQFNLPWNTLGYSELEKFYWILRSFAVPMFWGIKVSLVQIIFCEMTVMEWWCHAPFHRKWLVESHSHLGPGCHWQGQHLLTIPKCPSTGDWVPLCWTVIFLLVNVLSKYSWGRCPQRFKARDLEGLFANQNSLTSVHSVGGTYCRHCEFMLQGISD